MKDKSGKINLFAHPITFVLTHVVFPLFAVGALGYVYWLTVEALAKAEGALGTKMLVALCASAAIPVAAALRLAVGPKRIGVLTQIGFALLIVAFAYFAFPVMGEATEKVDSWIIGPTAFLSFFIGIVPPIFAGVARIATANWKLDFGPDLGLTLLMTIGGPFGVYVVFQILCAIWRMAYKDGGSEAAKTVSSITGHLAAVGVVLGTLVLFIGFLRLMHLIASRFGTKDERLKRIVTALIFGLALPWGGLALNLHIPFPADFANPWPWVLSAVTTLAMIVETKPSREGLALWFLKLAMAPFVLYFFLLFVPFLPLAVLAILAMGAGFLILAPTILFRYYTASVFDSWKVLRGTYSKARLIAIAALGFLVIPLGFVVDVEIERAGLKALVKWHTEEDFDAPPAPLPVSKRQAERIVKNANDFADGAEIPFLSAWRTFRVYDGMYMSDSLREELNLRILGKKLSKDELDWNRRRNFFGAGMFGGNAGRRSNRNMSSRWTSRPPRTKDFTATCESKGSGEYLLKVHAKKDLPVKGWGDQEFVAPFRLPAGTWIEGMRLKMDDGTWKDAKASERKAAEFVYRHITEQRRDPSIITLDTPTSGMLKIFPVGEKGRDVEITLRTTALAPLMEPIVIGERAVRASVPWGGPVAEFVTAKDAAVTLVSAAWMDAHTNELVKAVAGCDVQGFSLDDPEFKGDLRRHLRLFATMMATNAPGVMPSFEFARTVPEKRTYKDGKYTTIPATNEVVASLVELPRDCRFPEAFLTTIRRELPGVVAFGDRPLDGWYVLEVEDGGKVVVPYRKGEGALVFTKVKGATVDGGKWSEGAKLWVREREAFLKPALDLRQELLDGTRATGVLTTQSAYLAVETSAQEKALKQKEMEALYGNKAFDFEEPPEQPTSGDAPGLFLILGGFLIVLLVRRKWHVVCAFCLVACAASAAVPLKNGTRFALNDVPGELVVERRAGEPVRFALEENGTTGYQWAAEWNTNECEVVLDHRGPGGDQRVCGAAGTLDVAVTSRIYTPARIEFAYRRPWEKGVKPIRALKLIVYTVGEAKSPLYPKNAVNRLLKAECAKRGIVLTDWHLHIRGGMTPEMALERERDSGIRSTAMENHGREWEIYDDAKLVAFAKRSRAVNPKMPVGIQVNDRDWFEKIAPETRAQFDYILADTMIMGKLPSGRDNRLWMVKEIPDPEKWMADYFAHTMRILDEPISILANPTYLPEPLAGDYDRLWTEERMRTVIAKAVKKGIALEIQAESPYPRPQFLKLAKAMGAKFSFGTNNFDPSPKDLSRWLEAITWLDLNPTDIWSPGERWRMSASAMDLYGEMLAHSSGESLLDVEMACVEGRWDRMTVEFLCNELKTEDPVKLRFEDEQMDRHSLAAYFLSTMLDIKLPKGSEQPPCLIRCRLVPDETEVHRGFMSPHRIHVFRISEAGRKFALEKGLTYLRSGKL